MLKSRQKIRNVSLANEIAKEKGPIKKRKLKKL